jgi:excisionase family DNA binding protein
VKAAWKPPAVDSVLLEVVEQREGALRVKDLARLLSVSRSTIYRKVQARLIPSAFRFYGSIRFEPRLTARWLRDEVLFVPDGNTPANVPLTFVRTSLCRAALK